ncbi:MAG: hypothetical protein BroJett025_02270 [Patescibacteria group bacterium]|nr:MAG: hypothetical protein BroJett025_02270 [Patescibacteria group bacterium]
MSFVTSLIPKNLNQEKEKFFADQTYNPQFRYAESIDQNKLEKYGPTTNAYLKIAENIVEKAYFGKTEDDLQKMEGPVVSQRDIEKTIYTFLHMHNLQKRFKIVWSSSFVSRTSITADTIKLRLPPDFRKEGLLGMLYHEVGTHALRRINYEKQPWFKSKKKYGFSDYLKTEEGLATLHFLMPRSFKFAYWSALDYITVSKAQHASFVEIWNFLGTYIQNPERRWLMALKKKRGLTDTSKPGGYTKDLVYFEGLIDVYGWLKKNNFDSTNLYFGKLALEDVEKAILLNPKFHPQLPSFLSLSKEKYAQEIKKIGDYNEL